MVIINGCQLLTLFKASGHQSDNVLPKLASPDSGTSVKQPMNSVKQLFFQQEISIPYIIDEKSKIQKQPDDLKISIDLENDIGILAPNLLNAANVVYWES